MFDIDRFREILQTISRNKMRSILTAFGVFWGVFMFILLYGVGTGFQNGMMKGITTSVSNSVMIFSDKTSVEYKGFNAGRYWDMTTEDVELIRNNIQGIEYAASSIYMGSQTLLYQDFSGTYNARGIDEFQCKVDPQILLAGRFLNKIDIAEKRKACVIGNKICNEVFDSYDDAIGKRISFGGRIYTVVGVVTSNGQVNMGGVPSQTIFFPISVGQQIYGYGNSVHAILVSAYPNVPISNLESSIKDLLKAKHLIAPSDETAVSSFNVHKVFLTFNNLFLGLKVLIWIVGMGTLLSGVVGVSNIMLITIRERTKEIGIRRALGAKPSLIIRQIVSESMLLTFIAGFAGFFFALLILILLDNILTGQGQMFATPIISFNMALFAIFIVMFTGACAGIIPAKNALKIKAIDALRDE